MTKKCFMVQPFDGGKFDKRFDDVFAPAVKDAGLEPYRVDRDAGAGIPIVDIERGIRDAVAVLWILPPTILTCGLSLAMQLPQARTFALCVQKSGVAHFRSISSIGK